MPTRIWNKAAGGDWSDHNNWTPDTVPTVGDSVFIEQVGASTAAYTVTFNEFGHPDIEDLTINFSGATLTFEESRVLNVATLTDLVAGTIDLERPEALLDTVRLNLVQPGTAALIDVGDGGTLEATTGGIANAGRIESTSGIGTVIGTLSGTGTVEAFHSTLVIASAVSTVTDLKFRVSDDPTSVLQMNNTVAAGNTFTFEGPAGELLFVARVGESQKVVGMNVATGDTLTNLVGLRGDFTIDGGHDHTGHSANIILSNGTITDTLSLSGITNVPASGPWFANALVLGGTTDVFLTTVPCYAPGTCIATPAGEMAVEDLQIGGLVLTASGATKPIKWIGRRSYSAAVVAETPQHRPVLIRKDALGAGLPRRNLMVSPMHGLCIDDVFVPAAALVNGVSIMRHQSEGPVEYIHIELNDHDVVLAEGVPAESFVDDDSRTMFDNASEYYDLYGFAERQGTFCAPRLEEGYRLEAIRRRFAARAGIAPSVAVPGEMAGHVERLRDGELEGWVMDRANPDTPVELEVRVDGEIVVTMLANRYRPDLDRAGLASGRCAFLVAMPATAEDISQVEVRRVSDRSNEASVLPVWQSPAKRAPQRATTTDPDLRLRSRRPQQPNGRPVYQDGNLAIFNLPRGSREIRLISRAQSPSEARPWLEDRRRLGVCVKRIVLRGANELREIPMDHPDLTKGWWNIERDGQIMSRWTNGDAVVPLPAMDGPVMLEIHLAGEMIYALEAEPESQSATAQRASVTV